MKRSDISEFEFEEDGLKLRLSSKSNEAPQVIQAATTPLVAAPPANVPSSEQDQSVPPTEELDISVIKSPMVGTFYRSASPDSPPFTDTGAKVGSDSVVCIIEAMKVMNEIQSEWYCFILPLVTLPIALLWAAFFRYVAPRWFAALEDQ